MAPKGKYPLIRAVELQVALAMVSAPRFHDTIGFALEPDRMPSEDAKLAVDAAQAVARETHRSCPSPTLALQQLRWRVNQGQLTMEEMAGVADLYDLAEDMGGVPDVDSLISAVAPLVKKAKHQAAVEQTISEYGHSADPAEAAERFAEIAALGTRRVAPGSELLLDQDSILRAATATVRDPLSTGIMELDAILGGGLERGALGLLLANTGDGKSLELAHIAAEAAFSGHDVAYVTLEISEELVQQRLYCNLTNLTTDEIAKNPQEAARRMGLLKAKGFGRVLVVYMTPGATTPAMIEAWLKEQERERAFKPELLIVDYQDKLVSSPNTQKHSYEDQKLVSEGLRNILVERDIWGWTASQAGGRQGRKKKLDLEDVADSMHKARIADLIIAILRTEEDCANGDVRFRVPKRRNGEAHGEVGPLPMDAAHGRMVAMSRSEPW
jgi:hypothetical protein